MAVRFDYGAQLEVNFRAAGESLAHSVENGRFWEISKLINRSFFGGGVLSPKRFSHIATIKKPIKPKATYIDDEGQAPLARIGKRASYSAVAGYIECIPSIGPMFAIVNAMFHTAGMFHSYSKLKNAVQELHAEDGDLTAKTYAVFKASVNFTMHQNHLVGSLLSLVPLLKPITRLGQGIIYHIKKEVKAHAEHRHLRN